MVELKPVMARLVKKYVKLYKTDLLIDFDILYKKGKNSYLYILSDSFTNLFSIKGVIAKNSFVIRELKSLLENKNLKIYRIDVLDIAGKNNIRGKIKKITPENILTEYIKEW